MRTRDAEEDDLGVDLTSMIDCVFLLLIFFLVATTLKRLDRELQVELPSAVSGTQTKLDPATVVIGIDVNGALFIDAEPVSYDQLHERLRQTSEQTPDARVRVQADRNARYDSIIHVLDQCLFWGLDDVGFHLRDSGSSTGR